MPILSLQIYYHGHVKYCKPVDLVSVLPSTIASVLATDSIKSAYQSFKNVVWVEFQKRNWTPLFKHRLTALAIGNALNILA